MSGLKPALRRLLPPRVVRALGQAHRTWDAGLGGVAGRLLHGLPLRAAAVASERWHATGYLDYPGAEIVLGVQSEAELVRLNSCQKEPETVEWIERFIRPGDVVFDIGANVGAYSLVIDRSAGGKATVYAFEPSFSTFGQLCRNVMLNGAAGRVVPVMIALSDRKGLVPFNYSSVAPGAALHTLGDAVDNKGRPFPPAYVQPVPSLPLDEFVREFSGRPPNHVKLDVDGVELQVLEGARGALADPALRTLLVEMEPAQPDFAGIIAMLTRHGFQVHGRYPHGAGSDATTNYIFTRQS